MSFGTAVCGRFYEDDDPRELDPQHAAKIARVLARLDIATRPEQLDLPGFGCTDGLRRISLQSRRPISSNRLI
jgi:hypothetical protein